MLWSMMQEYMTRRRVLTWYDRAGCCIIPQRPWRTPKARSTSFRALSLRFLNANVFNNSINITGLVDLPLEGYCFTWAHKSASKMSKLDRFLISKGLLTAFPSLSAICLDKHLSDHCPILMRELNVDYGPTPFRFFHSWFDMNGFDKMVEDSWKKMDISYPNSMISLKKKLQALKISIKQWLKEAKSHSSKVKASIQKRLIDLDKSFDQGTCNDELLLERTNLLKELHDINSCTYADMRQKAKVLESVRRDFFNGVLKSEKRLALIGWNKVMASKKMVGSALHGANGFLDNTCLPSRYSPWIDIVREFKNLVSKGINLFSFIKKTVGNGESTSFWDDQWVNESTLKSRDIIAVLGSKGDIIAVLDGMSILSGRKSVPGIVAVNGENGKIDYSILT
nr:RNA-directed DNA polymerase, eukaryota [Tanacetum cinerariifolium]